MFTQISRVIATRADFLNDDFYNDIIALSSAKKVPIAIYYILTKTGI